MRVRSGTGLLRIARRAVLVLAVVAVATLLHLSAVGKLPIDFDEDDYLRAGQQYAAAIRSGDWAAFTQENYRTEHPALAKIAYGVALLTVPPAPTVPDESSDAPPATTLPEPQLLAARVAAATFGTLEVLLLAILSPLAGLFLAVGTWQLKYTSQVMLEALPSLTSALVVLCYVAALRWPRHRRAWLIASAVALGLTAAGKYLYAVAGIAVAVHWLWETRVQRTPKRTAAERPASAAVLGPRLLAASRARLRWLAPVGAWGLLAIAVFVLADPYLWPDPVGRLWQSVTFHAGYAQSQHVTDAGYPPWQPFVWLFGSVPWHPGVFVISFDLVVTLFALAGLRRAWETRRVFVLWLAIGMAFLLVWPTKWPQYVLTITFPLSIVAVEGFHAAVAAWARGWWTSAARGLGSLVRSPRAWLGARSAAARDGLRALVRAAPWLAPAAVGLSALALFPLLYQVAMALTDFSKTSLKDGMAGGVLREAILGILGFRPEVGLPWVGLPWGQTPGSTAVHYLGPGLFLDMLSGGIASLAVFNVVWTVLAVALQTGLGVGVALLLARPRVRFAGWWRLLFVLPWAIPEFVGAVAFRNIFDPAHGWVSLATGTQIDWLVSGDLALLVSLLAATWSGWPLMLLAASAGLATIPRDVRDAASIDGAGRWSRFRHVTWPLLAPTLAPALLIRTIFAFNQFYVFYVFAYSTSGRFPLSTLALTSFFAFDPTAGGGQFAVSAALNLVTVVMLVAFALRLQGWQRGAERRAYA